ncbi:MAG: ABC transporter permease [Muribaculaceae bacterium]|nr:ABC transporter permease [Muribaculaceae bacterium]
MSLTAGIRREIHRLTSRRMYLVGMVIVPVFVAIFFHSILSEGLPQQVPSAVVDLDHSSMSRSMTRSLGALQTLSITEELESYDKALEHVREGSIFGFFVIPANFERDALSGQQPTLEYYSNMTYFVPGTLAFKGFKTVAVSTAAGVVKQTLASLGLSDDTTAALIQPVVIDENGLGNPWMSYSIYLCPSFSVCTLVLMIMLMTAFSITMEIKNGTSRSWLEANDGSIVLALATKLLPQTVIFSSVALFILWLLFGFSHIPLNGSLAWMIVATLLTVLASQAFGTFAACVVPNPRLSMIICALFGILSFSFTGFSFPVESMYGWLGVFSWLAPIRYWFLIYINEALNGVDLYYSRYYFAALILFIFGPALVVWNLKRMCLKPVYVP